MLETINAENYSPVAEAEAILAAHSVESDEPLVAAVALV